MCKKFTYVVSVGLVLGLVLTEACEAGDPTLVGHWTFDEGSGTTALDQSDNGNHGTIRAGAEWVVGQLGGALSFAAGGGVDVPPAALSSIERYVTLAFWAYGDPDLLPAETSAFQVYGGTGRVLGAHIPWSNGRVYFDAAGDRIDKAATPEEYEGSWQHWAFTKDAEAGEQKIYLNGVLWHSGTGMTRAMSGKTLFHIGHYEGSQNHRGMMDDFQLYNHALTESEIRRIMRGVGPFAWSGDPNPANGAADVSAVDGVLSWTPGDYAATHDVYFGTNFDDVNDASQIEDLGGVYLGRQEVSKVALDRLDFGQTYYWRIDEVNAAPDYTVFKGNVWQFTVEPYTYPIRDIVATASSVEEGAGPENTINELGLNASDQHSTEESHMWLSDADGEQPTWIQYEFPEAYKLYEMWIWNYNVPLEQIVGFGFKDVTIEHSVNGVEWAVLGDHEFAQGTGKSTYVHNTVVDLAGVVAKYVRLTANSNWGGLDQYGLSEVRFYYVPVVAREPEPSDGQSDLELDVVLDWRGGREAVAHEVYFSTDREAVETGTALVTTVGESRYEVSALNLGTTYYWRIDEVNEAAVPSAWEGLVWTFSTQEYIVVDDFEAYKGDDNAIYETWVDGYEDDTNGSQVGYLVSPFVEKAIVRGGTQSMPLYYDNSATDYSEATVNIADLSITQAWTESNIKTLSLWFYGDSANAVQQMYVKLNGSKVLYDGDAGDITRIPWQPWNIDLATLGVDLGNVTELSVGFERGGLAGASGMVLFDDIRLYPFERQWITPVEPDTANLMVHYTFDGNFQDSSGNGYDGEALDNVAIDDDPVRGKVARFDGDWDAVDVPSIGTSNEITIAMWVYMEDPSQEFNSCFNGNGWKDGALHFKVERSLVIGHLFGLTKAVGTTVLPAKQWHHLVCTLSTTDTAVWLNGYLEASVAHPADLETAPTVTVGGGALGVWIPDSGMIERELTGKIDDVRIYNRALTQEEIAWLAGRTKPFDKPF
jgi:hypothetical protein